MSKNRHSRKWFCLTPGILTGCILAALFAVMQYAPFGNHTLAVMDANIQYLDFFAYLKNVLSGNDSIGYTFGKTLGGTNIAVFSYYLSSPLNLFAVFFRKEDLHIFFHMLILVKLSLAAVTFYIFLSSRFGDQLEKGIAVLLSVSYALCQYNLAQSSNIMWLDGVYMLPLMLLGVYRVVQRRGMVLLMLATGMSLIFNWYTGAINCLFSAIWFVVECFLAWYVYCRPVIENVKAIVAAGLRYAASMVIGLLLCAVLFVPALAALRSGRGGIDWSALSFGITGELPSVIQAYIMGGSSELGSVSLFCGSMSVTACIGCFFTDRLSKKEKIFTGLLISGMILLFYWRPCYFVFSLMKSVGSYWYRYSYIGACGFLFLAAFFFTKCHGKEFSFAILKSAGIFAAALEFMHYLKPIQDTKRTYLTAVFVILTASVSALCVA